MSDQVGEQFNTHFVGGGGGGITTLNGSAVPAQVLAAGAGISITPGPAGTNTIANTAPASPGVDSLVPHNAGVAQTGNVILALGIDGNINTVGSTFDAIPGAMVANLSSFAPGKKGLVSDPAAHLGDEYLGADNTFRPIPTSQVTALANGVVALVNGVLTPVNNLSNLTPGTYLLMFYASLNGIALQFADVLITFNTVPSTLAGFLGMVEVAGQPLAVSGCTSLVIGALTDVVAVAVLHHGGGANSATIASNMVAIRLS